MNTPDPYAAWLRQKRGTTPSPEAIDRIMARVSAEETAGQSDATGAWLQRAVDWISPRPLAQAAVLAAGFVLGALRLFAALQFLLT